MDDTIKLASIAAGIAFVIGLLYNYGYFTSLDPNFFTFLTYKDHLTALAFFAVPCLVLSLIFGAYRNKKPKLDYIAGILAAVTIVTLLEQNELVGFPSLTAFLRWYVGISSFFLIPYLLAVIVEFFFGGNWSQQPSLTQGMIGLSIIGLMVFIGAFGNSRAYVDVRTRSYELDVILAAEDKNPTIPRPAHLVRAIDEGMFLIFRDSPDHIAFVRKEAVKVLSRKLPKYGSATRG